MKFFVLFFAVLILLFDYDWKLPTYSLPKPATEQEIKQFHKLIQKIDNIVGEEFAFDSSKEFTTIYRNPTFYLAPAIALITCKETSEYDKRIIGYAMQGLPPEQFVVFLSSVVAAIEQNTIDIKILRYTVIMDQDFGQQPLSMFYYDTSVQTLLKRILKLKHLKPEFVSHLQDILSNGGVKYGFIENAAYAGKFIRWYIFGIGIPMSAWIFVICWTLYYPAVGYILWFLGSFIRKRISDRIKRKVGI
jgi:hypothetical protein